MRGMWKQVVCTLILVLGFGGVYWLHDPVSTHNKVAWYEIVKVKPDTVYQVTYHSADTGVEESLEGVQCPVPMKDRVRNYTGIQCVWSSIEMLGRWAEEPKLMNPPITSNRGCKSFAGPGSAASKLRELGVKFEQTAGDRKAGLALIKKAMNEGRACLFDIPGHAMVLIHYDESADVVKWVDNSDSSLRIHTTTVSKFLRMWDDWVLVIYADHDVIPAKMGAVNIFPIIDPKRPAVEFPREFVPFRAMFQLN